MSTGFLHCPYRPARTSNGRFLWIVRDKHGNVRDRDLLKKYADERRTSLDQYEKFHGPHSIQPQPADFGDPRYR